MNHIQKLWDGLLMISLAWKLSIWHLIMLFVCAVMHFSLHLTFSGCMVPLVGGQESVDQPGHTSPVNKPSTSTLFGNTVLKFLSLVGYHEQKCRW